MQNNKENLFAEKFRLLNSQEYNEEINLATSSSSDYEPVTHIISVDQNKSRTKKRKRKNKYSKNVSSLDITINDVMRNSKSNESDRSPLLCCKNRGLEQTQNIVQQSPILGSKNIKQKSPILSPKILLPLHSIKVKKKLLFENGNKSKNINSISKFSELEKTNTNSLNKSYFMRKDNIDVSSTSQNLDNDVGFCDKNSDSTVENISSSKLVSGDNAKKDLIKKVKLFFESHFSSEEISQNTISDCQTSPRSEESDIYISKSEFNSNCSPILSSIKEETLSPENSERKTKEAKKTRYKKDGLAYRLDNLLKKRKAHISLWQHERYLAGKSNFKIPKQEYIAFRIQKFHFKYGCYLLEAYDISDQYYCVVINSYYINETVKSESVLKLYKPYQFVDFNDNCKLVINVCKFQIVDINS